MPKLRMGTPSAPNVHTKRYSAFRGVDFSSDPYQVDDTRAPWAVNVIADASGCPRKRPGWRRLAQVEAPVRGIYRYETRWVKDMFIVHAGGKLYSWKGGEDTPKELMSGLTGEHSHGFMHKGRLYILTGKEYVYVGADAEEKTVYSYDADSNDVTRTRYEINDDGLLETRVAEYTGSPAEFVEKSVTTATIGLKAGYVSDVAYVPITVQGDTISNTLSNAITAESTAGGTAYEAQNMVSGWRRNNFEIDVSVMKEYYASDDYYALLDTRMPMDATRSQLEFVTAAGNVLENVLYFAHPSSGQRSYEESVSVSYDSRYAEASLRYLWIDAEAVYRIMTVLGDASTTANIRFPTGGTEDEQEKRADLKSRVDGCKFASWYNSRLFIAGCDEYPNADWYSEVNQPTYFKEINYTEIGTDDAAIMGYLPVGEQLAVIKAPGIQSQDAAVYLRRAEWDETVAGGYYFPIKRGTTGTGAVGYNVFASLTDDPMYISETGVMGLITDNITGERVHAPRSTRINAKLMHEDLSRAVCGVWQGYMLIAVDGNVYLADSRGRSYARNSAGNFEYEWYYWQDVPISCMRTKDNTLYFGTDNGKLCRLNDDLEERARCADYPEGLSGEAAAIVAEWSTRFDDDGDFMIKKNMTRRGCGVFLMGSRRGNVKILVRTDRELERQIAYRRRGVFDFNDMDFENFTFETQPRLVSAVNKKVKKYSAIQIICRSDEVGHDFGILGIERRWVPGYFNK